MFYVITNRNVKIQIILSNHDTTNEYNFSGHFFDPTRQYDIITVVGSSFLFVSFSEIHLYLFLRLNKRNQMSRYLRKSRKDIKDKNLQRSLNIGTLIITP